MNVFVTVGELFVQFRGLMLCRLATSFPDYLHQYVSECALFGYRLVSDLRLITGSYKYNSLEAVDSETNCLHRSSLPLPE